MKDKITLKTAANKLQNARLRVRDLNRLTATVTRLLRDLLEDFRPASNARLLHQAKTFSNPDLLPKYSCEQECISRWLNSYFCNASKHIITCWSSRMLQALHSSYYRQS